MSGPLGDMVSHKFVQANGIKVHYVEAGSGPTVVLLHGFPDLWYGWRHQIPALVGAGFHVVAPDLRGYGQTEIPTSADKYTSLHIVGDIVALLGALDLKQVLVVGHDWGANYGADLALFRPDLIKALVLFGVPYLPRMAGPLPTEILQNMMGNDTYLSVFQTPGVAEELFKTAKNEDILSAFLLRWGDNNSLVVPPFLVDEPLPDWVTKKDLKFYAEAFDKTGWIGPLNHYRALNKTWEVKAAWTNVLFPAQVPVLLIIGRQDTSGIMFGINSPSAEEGFATTCHQIMPSLKAHHYLDAHHFVHQEKPEEVNQILIKFLQDYRD